MKQTHKQPYHLHGIRALLFGVLLTALFIVRIDASSLNTAKLQSSDVLAYATNVSRNDLLTSTNNYRAQNGLPPLALNGALNTSSQNKAQHMIDLNYWAHVAPDGTQPWYFFDQAGYAYQTAGENLAYGFMSSSSIVDAWMNSPSHRDNILGNYAEVGFGYANGSNYQNGENTVVVAHYGTQQNAPAPAPAPTPAPVAPAPTPTAPASSPPASLLTPTPTTTTDTPENTPKATEVETSSTEPTTQKPESEKPSDFPTSTASPVAVGSTQGVNVLQRLLQSNPPLVAVASILMTVVAAAGFVLTHRSLVQHAVVNGEKFVMTHPAFDITALVAISILILTTTVSRIG